MHYVNLAAAIDTLTYAIRDQTEYERICGKSDFRAIRRMEFAAGVSFAIGMMLDPETTAIIEQAARERAEETTS